MIEQPKREPETWNEAVEEIKKELLTDVIPATLGALVLGAVIVIGVVSLLALARWVWMFWGLPW